MTGPEPISGSELVLAGTIRSQGAIAQVLSSMRWAPGAQLGLLLVVLTIVLAALGPLLTPDPNQQNLLLRLRPPAWLANGTWAHPLGTDELGRDLLARAAAGARVSMFVAIAAVVISSVFGVSIGLMAGYRPGLFSKLVDVVVDIQLAFPFVLLVILVVGVLGPGLHNLALVLGATGWIQYARVVRAQTAALRNVAYVRASEVLGLSAARIALVHILPNCMSAIVVIASFAVAQMILWEAALSFLGLGVQPPQVSWGMMLSGGRDYISSAPHLVVVPGLLIAVLVLGINLLGEWLRDALDPRLKLTSVA